MRKSKVFKEAALKERKKSLKEGPGAGVNIKFEVTNLSSMYFSGAPLATGKPIDILETNEFVEVEFASYYNHAEVETQTNVRFKATLRDDVTRMLNRGIEGAISNTRGVFDILSRERGFVGRFSAELVKRWLPDVEFFLDGAREFEYLYSAGWQRLELSDTLRYSSDEDGGYPADAEFRYAEDNGDVLIDIMGELIPEGLLSDQQHMWLYRSLIDFIEDQFRDGFDFDVIVDVNDEILYAYQDLDEPDYDDGDEYYESKKDGGSVKTRKQEAEAISFDDAEDAIEYLASRIESKGIHWHGIDVDLETSLGEYFCYFPKAGLLTEGHVDVDVFQAGYVRPDDIIEIAQEALENHGEDFTSVFGVSVAEYQEIIDEAKRNDALLPQLAMDVSAYSGGPFDGEYGMGYEEFVRFVSGALRLNESKKNGGKKIEERGEVRAAVETLKRDSDLAWEIEERYENDRYTFNVTYTTVTPESAELGDFEDSGFDVEDEISTGIEELGGDLKGYGFIYSNNYGRFPEELDFQTEPTIEDYGTGETIERTAFVKRVDGKPFSVEEYAYLLKQLDIDGHFINESAKEKAKEPAHESNDEIIEVDRYAQITENLELEPGDKVVVIKEAGLPYLRLYDWDIDENEGTASSVYHGSYGGVDYVIGVNVDRKKVRVTYAPIGSQRAAFERRITTTSRDSMLDIVSKAKGLLMDVQVPIDAQQITKLGFTRV